MNAVSFIANFELANEALKSYSFQGETRFKFALELTLKMEELELKNREIALLEEKTRQELELKALESRNKYENAGVELVKSLVQAQSMIKSVWDNANINKCNALVGLFNVAMNAQNTSALENWQSYFNEIKNSIYSIGQDVDTKGNKNTLVDDFEPLFSTVKDGLSELAFANSNIKQVAILAPKLELVKGESMVLRGISLFADTASSGFILEYLGEEYNTNTFLFKAETEGDFKISYFATNEKGERVKDSVNIKVLSASITT